MYIVVLRTAYNNGVVLGNRAFGGLCTKRVGAENASYAIRRLAIATIDQAPRLFLHTYRQASSRKNFVVDL